MNLEAHTIEFCRVITKGPNRDEVLRVVQKMQSSARGLGNKVYPTPILGLLLYNQEGVRRLIGKSAVEELEDWEQQDLNILFSVHQQVLEFNTRCLTPLFNILPEAVPATNPYKEYLSSVSFEHVEQFLFEWDNAQTVITEFGEHPAFDLIKKNVHLIDGAQIDYYEVLHRLNAELVESGPGGEPEWVRYMKDAHSFDESPVPLHVFVGLLCLFDSLSNLNQLIFQALFGEEFVNFDREQIIDYVWTTRGPGPSMWLMQLPTPYLFFIDTGDIVAVSTDKPDVKGGLHNRLCTIAAQTVPLTLMTPGILEMRMIDRNLNSYSYLLPRSVS
ncbi:MAG: hypothetical protein ACKVQJ_02970 [Pyrinomonadaceae bacterium]